ncbi:MAG: MerR family transcriptional regulator [Dehalococcoidales bacterium]
MPVVVNGQTYYRTVEVCRTVGISRNTLFRWLKAGILKQSYRDRRGWRMFTEDDLSRIQAEARKIEVIFASPGGVSEKHK